MSIVAETLYMISGLERRLEYQLELKEQRPGASAPLLPPLTIATDDQIGRERRACRCQKLLGTA
jgi:hypothetical protein